MSESTPSQLAESARILAESADDLGTQANKLGEEKAAYALNRAQQKFNAVATKWPESEAKLFEGVNAAKEARTVAEDDALADRIQQNLIPPFENTNRTDSNVSTAQ